MLLYLNHVIRMPKTLFVDDRRYTAARCLVKNNNTLFDLIIARLVGSKRPSIMIIKYIAPIAIIVYYNA